MSNLELKGFKRLYGLDSLMNDAKKQINEHSVSFLSVEVLSSGKYQPRTKINDESLNELASSIKAQGIIQPIIVRGLENGHYEIIAGERRWRAAKIVGLTKVPAIIRNVSDETALAFALIESIQREGLNTIDEAQSLERLKNEFSMTHEEIAERVGRSRSAVTNLIRLLSLHPSVKDFLRANKMEMGHARALLSLSTDKQLLIAQRIMDQGLSVRETEKIIKWIKEEPSLSNERKEKINYWNELLPSDLSSKIKIHLDAKGKGKVIILVKSHEEVEVILTKLKQ